MQRSVLRTVSNCVSSWAGPDWGQQDLMPTLVGMSWEAVPFRGRSSHIVRICFTVFHDNHLRSFSLGKPGMGWREMSMDPPQVELAMATKTASGRYSGCPDISTEFSAGVTAMS